MTPIDASLLQRFVRLAVRRLSGDWVILGGAVLPLVGVPHRVTYDIDIAGPEGSDQTLEVLRIAESLGLPVEAVNLAGAFFLHRIEGWREHLLPVAEGTRASVNRPDATLYVLTKIARLSESDLADCQRYLEYARTHGEPVDAERLRSAIRREVRKRPDTARRTRLRALLNVLEEEVEAVG